MEVEKTAIENSKQIATLWESVKSAHKRIDENDKITAGIHELAKNVALMASEIKSLTAKLDESVARIERGQTLPLTAGWRRRYEDRKKKICSPLPGIS